MPYLPLFPSFLRLCLTCIMVLALGACAQFSTKKESTQTGQAIVRIHKTDEEESKSKDFPPETLFDLMLAELALNRDMPDVTLTYYRMEAAKTRDPAVIKRALEISTWLEAHEVSLELMGLWQEVEPDNPNTYQFMAQQQIYFGMLKSALVSVERVLELGADFNFDYFNQMLPELNEQERAEVLSELEKLSLKFPKNAQLWLSRAYVYALMDQRDSALKAAEKAIHLDSKDANPVVVHAKLSFNYNNHKTALKEMEKGIRKFPESHALHLLYIESLLKLGKTAKAEQHMKQSVKQFNDDLEYQYQLAVVAFNYKQYQMATELFQSFMQNEFRWEQSCFYLSRVAEEQGDYEAAVAYLKMIQPGEAFIQARLQIAFLLIEAGKNQQAIKSLEEAQSLQADNAGAFYHAKADLLVDDGKEQEAMQVFATAINAYPESIKLRFARSLLAEQLNKLDIAERDLKKVIELEPKNALALNALGYTLTNKTNRHKEALVYISRALELSPEDPAIIDSMGWVQFHLGNHEVALKYLRQAIALSPDHEIAAHLGEVLWVSGFKTEAQRVWDDALANNKDSEVLKSVMDRYLK